MSAQKDIIVALDEGTTNAKAVALDSQGNVVAKFSQALAIHTPREGWVEQSGDALLEASLAVVAQAIAAVGAHRVAAHIASPRWRSAINVKRRSAGIVPADAPSALPSPGSVRGRPIFVVHYVNRAARHT